MRYFLLLAIISLLSIGTFIIPSSVTFAAGECDGNNCGLVTCSGGDCDFQDFMRMVNRVISFLLFVLAPVFAMITFTMAGWKILTAGGNSGKVSEAKKMMWNVVIGYLIAVSAWLIVKLIFNNQLIEGGFLFFIDN